jgi:hypothetical protein
MLVLAVQKLQLALKLFLAIGHPDARDHGIKRPRADPNKPQLWISRDLLCCQ